MRYIVAFSSFIGVRFWTVAICKVEERKTIMIVAIRIDPPLHNGISQYACHLIGSCDGVVSPRLTAGLIGWPVKAN